HLSVVLIFKEHVAVATRGAHYTDRLLPVKLFVSIILPTNPHHSSLTCEARILQTFSFRSREINFAFSLLLASPLKRAAHFTDLFASVKRKI
ncbi:hypothetical protein, partial [Methylobacillus sp. MM3]|uniref:hypothetical protein n=1 Tax=Methylobacillus sp. MM3 TaxID=1848039 RepID=UPI001969D529